MNCRRLIAHPHLGRGIVADQNGLPEGVASRRSKINCPMSDMGLGRVKTFCWKRSELCEVAMRAVFSDFDYARIAAISGWMPMMFITRVRL